MKIKFLSGPRKGDIDHAPRGQQTQLLIDVRLIEVIDDTPEPRIPSKDDVIPSKPPRGWEAGLFMWGDDRRPAIIFHDGQGGKMVYDGPPAPQRRWSATEQRHVMVSSDCPAEVIAQFHILSGNQKEAAKAREEAEREARRNAEEAVARNKPGRYDAQVLAARLMK